MLKAGQFSGNLLLARVPSFLENVKDVQLIFTVDVYFVFKAEILHTSHHGTSKVLKITLLTLVGLEISRT